MDLKVWAPLSGVDESILDTVRLAYVFGRQGTESLIITEDDEVYVSALNSSGCFPIENDGSQNATPGRLHRINALTAKCVKGLSFGCNKTKPNSSVQLTTTFMVVCTAAGSVIQFGRPSGNRNDACDIDVHFSPFAEFACRPVISEVACGSQHCLALSTEGKAYTWGSNEFGQIGNGYTTVNHCQYPYNVEGELKNERVVQISCGFSFSVVVLSSGKVFFWGKDAGDGNKVSHFLPVLIPMYGAAVREIACGYAHVLALTDTSELYVWGMNNRGQLGLGDNEARPLPDTSINETFGNVVEIAASYLSSISAVRTANYEIFMWGDCAGTVIREPMKTPYKSVMEVFAYYSSPRVTYKPITHHSLSQSWNDTVKRAFEDEETSDLTIEAEGKEIFVHKTILKLSSDYFRTLLQNQWTKENQKIVEVKQRYDIIHSYLRYLYTRELDADPELAIELLVLADEYQDLPFKELCEKEIQCGIDINNVGILYPLALKLNATRIVESCLSFASSHTSELVKTPAFSKWDKDVLVEFCLQCEKRKLFKT